MDNESKVCKNCGEDLEYVGYYFESVNGEDYCCIECCIQDLRKQNIVALDEDGRYYFNFDFYDEEELEKEIGEWV